ncbi:MAG: hypothetical protein QCH35_08090 [Methanomicrobiaceae archaeon]|nr:hypothetical protein [Methanomicrobiaceae archaeon]
MGADFRGALRNYYGGLIGIAIYLAVTAVVSFAAFMAAFGNPTPAAEAVLGLAAIYFTVARPLWMIPIAYLLGGLVIRKK